jgi:putative membrane protein
VARAEAFDQRTVTRIESEGEAMWGPMMGYGYGGWMMVVGGLFWIAVLALVIYLGFRLAGQTGRGQSDARSSGLGVLDERYARGEIEREEFLQKRQDLLGTGGASAKTKVTGP